MKRTGFIIFLLSALFLSSYTYASENILSQYTYGCILDFTNLKVRIKDVPSHEKAVNMLEEKQSQFLSGLENNARDYEQEKCILESMFLLEKYEHSITDKNRDVLRRQIKSQMIKNNKVLAERNADKVSIWFYYVSSDVISYYMTRSPAATIRYGIKVKKGYEKASDGTDVCSGAYVSLGNWLYYAPSPFGSKKKAQSCFIKAVDSAKTDGDRYIAYEYLSQLYFEAKDNKKCSEYLDKALSLNLSENEVKKVKKMNASGISLFEYYRKRSGIDEEIPEDMKEEDDR